MQKTIAIVSGGAGYIGSTIAEMLAQKGAAVELFDFNGPIVKATAERLVKEGFDVCGNVVDICDYAAVENAVEEVVRRRGRVDLLVNSAGGSARKEARPFATQKIEVLHKIIDMNLYGALHCMRAVVPHMIEANHGKIVNISSLVALGGVRWCADYAAAKAGLISATKTLAMELGQNNINVNCVCPGKVQRPAEMPADPEAFAHKHSFLNRICLATDVANLVCFLASPEADYITGQNYVIDGGRSLGLKGDNP